MTYAITTDTVAPQRRVAFWQEMLSQTFVPAHCESKLGDRFCGTLTTKPVAQVEITTLISGQQKILRTGTDIASSSQQRFYFSYQATGDALVRQRGVETIVNEGDMVLLDCCEPYTVQYEKPVTSIVLQVPHVILRDRFRFPERALGRCLKGNRDVMRLAAEFLHSCSLRMDGIDSPHQPAVSSALLNLFSSVLADVVCENTDASTHQAVLLMRAKQHLLARMGDPNLTPEMIARSMGLSGRYLRRIFQVDGLSFGRFLLQQRIERCRQELASPYLRNLRVSEIALRSGFNNLAHFSRVFRDALGQSPTEYRKDCFMNLAPSDTSSVHD